MTPRPLDRRFLLVSLLLHAAVGALLLIVFPGSPLRPVAEAPPLTVTLLPSDVLPVPAPPAPVQPRPATPAPHRRAVLPAPAPLPAEPVQPLPTTIPEPEVQEHESHPAAPPPFPTPPTSTTPTTLTPSTVPLPGAGQGARAIYQPIPTIPDELREEALSAVAIARFHVAPDGTVTVELINPTRNPRLNQMLLDTLKTWRFFPATKDGHPVASTQDLRISVEVK